jgi:hypothetical protein
MIGLIWLILIHVILLLLLLTVHLLQFHLLLLLLLLLLLYDDWCLCNLQLLGTCSSTSSCRCYCLHWPLLRSLPCIHLLLLQLQLLPLKAQLLLLPALLRQCSIGRFC